MVGIVGSVNGVGNSRISFCRLTFCIIRIDLFTSVHGPRRCLRISNNKGGKKWTGRETREEEKREKPYCVARATTLLLLLQLKLHSFVRRKRAETLERESVGEEKKRVDRRGQGDGDERRGERWKGQGKNPRNVPREHFEIGWQWFKITPSKVPRRPLSNLLQPNPYAAKSAKWNATLIAAAQPDVSRSNESSID